MHKHIELLEQAKSHYAADMLLKGTYGDDETSFRGCSVGCHLHHIQPDLSAYQIVNLTNKHKIVADYYEYPEWLARLQDAVFEGLPTGDHSKWHVQLAEAIASRKGQIDWQETLHRVHIGILRISYRTAGTAAEAVQAVIDLHEKAIRGEPADDAARSAAWSAARSAAWSAARSAAWSAAQYAAWSAAQSAKVSTAVAASDAAWSAARSAAWSSSDQVADSSAHSAAYKEIRDAILVAIVGKD